MFRKHIVNVFIFFIISSCGWPCVLSNITQFSVDIGKNLTIPCGPRTQLLDDYDQIHGDDVMWVREGRKEMQISRWSVQPDASLFLADVTRNDTGVYVCFVEVDDSEVIIMKAKVLVRTPPPPLHNVVVHPSTILALILWEVKDTGGYPIIDFTAEYKLANSNESWKPITPNHISPNSRQIDVYKLIPNTTYAFRVWGTNQLGKGEVTEVEGRTLHNISEAELAQLLLAGAETFDTRVWVVAVAIVMGTLVILSAGTCYVLYTECRTTDEPTDEQEVIELVPNIILNPGYEEETTRQIPADENCNSETTLRLNNNTVVQPRRL